MKQTFSQKVKNEILTQAKNISPCCALACLSAIIRGGGSLSITSSGLGFALSSSNLDMLKFVNLQLLRLYKVESDIVAEKNNSVFSMEVACSQLLFDGGILYVDEQGLTQISDKISPQVVEKDCCKKAYVKGLFLVSGSAVVPDNRSASTTSAGYHLEFGLSNIDIANSFNDLLSSCNFNFKVAERNSGAIVYVKDNDAVGDMLVFLGANGSKFAFEDIVIERQLRNNANRQTNCISANIDKTVDASEKQISAITSLIEHGQLGLLDEKLRIVADKRMENPEASLDELARQLNISKSGFNHRMRKLMELASVYKDLENE